MIVKILNEVAENSGYLKSVKKQRAYPLTRAPRLMPNGRIGRPGDSRPPEGMSNLCCSGFPTMPELSYINVPVILLSVSNVANPAFPSVGPTVIAKIDPPLPAVGPEVRFAPVAALQGAEHLMT
jgi:hypothetical protein